MASRDYIPAVERYIVQIADAAAKKIAVCPDVSCAVERDIIRKLSEYCGAAYSAIERLKQEETEAASISNAEDRADCYCNRVLPVMNELRAAVDAMETLTASNLWPVPTYGDMMFRV